MDPFHYYINTWGGHWPILMGAGVAIGLLGLIWVLYWKAMSLWHAVKNGEKAWFVALLIINTFGILEILYLYFFSKNKQKGWPKLE